MGMFALFACGKCGHEYMGGNFRGNEYAPNEYACPKCRIKTKHIFKEYISIDERNDAQRMRDRLEAGRVRG
jgi:DNA-directed RNA polymerase subunit RPC12/RpoP